MHVAICTKDSWDGAKTPNVAAKPPETPIIPNALPVNNQIIIRWATSRENLSLGFTETS